MDEDEEYDDELPPISVNSTRHVPGKFCMPSAEELASQRAREEECERELRAMREAAERGEAAAGLGLARCDSSGSEGEAGLAAAVSALAVHSAAADRPAEPRARREPAALAALGAALAAGAAVGAAEDELAAAAGWLCAQAAAAGGGPAARRALHRLLLDAGPQHVPAIARRALEAVRTPRARLDLVDALAAARGEPAARRLAALVCRAALTDLLGQDDAGDEGTMASQAAWNPLSPLEVAALAGGWRRGTPDVAYLALQLAARALLVASPASAAELRPAVAALTQPPAAAPQHRHRPDYLKVVVAASKLQLLFRDKD